MDRKLSLNLLIVSTFIHVSRVYTATPSLQSNTTATLSLEASSSTIPASTPPALSAITSDPTTPASSAATESRTFDSLATTLESNTPASLETISESTLASNTSISELTSSSLESTSQSVSLENTSQATSVSLATTSDMTSTSLEHTTQSTSVSLASTSDMTSASLATTSDLKSESLAPTSVSTSASFENTSVLTSVSLANTSESTTLEQSAATPKSTSASLATTSESTSASLATTSAQSATTSESTSASLATTSESTSASLATTSESPSASIATTSESASAQSATTSESTSASFTNAFESTSAQPATTLESTSVSLAITAESQTSESLASTSESTSVTLVTTSESTSAYSTTSQSTITDSLTITSELTTSAKTSPASHVSLTTTHETQATTTPSDSLPPNCTTGFDIQHVTHNQVIFNVTNITDDHTFEYYVINTHSNGTTNNTNGNCDLTIQYCYVSKNTTLAVNGLLSGTPYTFSFRTAKKGKDDTFLVSSGICENVSFHTAPSTPTNVSVPKGFIFETNFTVNVHMLDDRFSHLDIFARTESCIIIISNKTGDYENISLVVDKLSGATNYSITVTAVLDNFTKSKESEPIHSITAPLPPNATLEASQNSSIELMLTNHADAWFDEYLIRYNNPTERHGMRVNQTSALIQNLHPGTSYTFRVFTVLSSITSERYATVNTFTRPSPVLAKTVNITLITNSSIHLVWDSVISEHADGYYVSCNCSSPNTNELITQTSSSSLPSASCTGLDPGTFCTIYIQTYIMNYEHGNLTGEKMFIHLQNSTSEEGPSGDIDSISSAVVTSKNATINWSDPCYLNGILTAYYVELNKTAGESQGFQEWKTEKRNIVLDGLLPFRNYSVRVKAANSAGNGTYNAPHGFQTKIDVPDSPSDVTTGNVTCCSIEVRWKRALNYTGPTQYTVIATDYRNTSIEFINTTHVGWWTDELANTSVVLGLDQFWNYSIMVIAETAYGNLTYKHNSTPVIITTAEDRPGKVQNLNVTAEKDLQKPRKVYVSWDPPIERDRNGIIVHYEIYCTNGNQTMVTTPSNRSLIIPLSIDSVSNVTVQVRAETSVGLGKHEESTVEVDPGSKAGISAPNLIPAIVGGLAAAVVAIVIVAAFVYTKRTNRVCFSANAKTVESARIVKEIEISELASEYVFKTGTISLAAFPDQVDKMHKDSNLLFADAFKMLKDKNPAYPSTAAESQQCRPKNRYTDIMPFDHSRVKLLAVDDVEGSDFINANFIPGYTSPREYIATQGPMQMTFDDFWRMVWEQSVDTIVMLTKLVEKGRTKCDQYWPTLKEPVFYGDIVVSIKSESNLPDYTLRIFEIKPSKGPSRIVKHFLYLKWPDMGCPDDPQMLLDFVKSVRDHTQRPDRTNPTVVHCSAGVGRTGTFIAVDHLLQHIRDHDDVDIFQLVLDMRKHRCKMVQTEDQLIYIYECLKTFITNDEDQAEPLYQNSDFGADNIYVNAGFQTDL